MPTFPSATTSYLTRIKSALNTGTDFGNGLSGAPANYLRAQDLATALELLQDAFNSSAALTAVTGSTTTLTQGTKASGALTFSGTATDTQTVTIGARTYTFQTTLTNVAGNVLIGADAAASIVNLARAVTAGAGSGSLYAAATTVHPTVTGVATSATVFTATALLAGEAGNAIVSTDTLTNASWGRATLFGGSDGFAVNAMAGQKVTFTGNVTAALAGVTAIVASNTAGVLTFTTTLPAAVAAGDTYTISGAIFDKHIASLREGKAFGEAPPGNMYGSALIARDALVLALQQSGTPASLALTFSGTATDTQTATVGNKVYTFQTTLTNVDGNVLIGANAAASIVNLAAAVNLGSGSGTTYAAAMTANVNCIGEATSATVFTAKARQAGTSGNSIKVAETLTNAAWAGGGTVLAGGVDAGVVTEKVLSWPSMACGTGSTDTVIVCNITNMAIDQFKGQKCTISGASRRIVGNTESTLVLNRALGSAPSAATAISITVPLDDDKHPSMRISSVFPGGQPGENYRLANLLDQVQTAFAAMTNPV